MKLSLVGTGSDTLLEFFELNDIEYSKTRVQPGLVLNSAPWVEIAAAVPSVALASVLVAWLRARASRKLIITKPDRTVVHVEGMSAEELAELLPLVNSISALETQKPELGIKGKE